MDIIFGIFNKTYLLFNEMAPYLLFGYFFAGILHIFIDTKIISKNLGKKNLGSVIKAALFGIPLPLCSCSVIPSAMSLRKEGATRGSVLSFLISTPTTGIDSIFATYSLLGWFFTGFRILSSFFIGVLSGVIANVFIKEDGKGIEASVEKCKLCSHDEEHEHTLFAKIRGIFNYAFGDLLKDNGGSLLLGILIGGMISFFIPEEFVQIYMGTGIKSMMIMLLAGIPMYVCATASIPIAAALMMKGLDPGAALVFLIAGPATNIVTMTVVFKNLGAKSLVTYLGAIITGSLMMGLLINRFLKYTELSFSILHRHEMLPEFVNTISVGILAIIIFGNLAKETLFNKFFLKTEANIFKSRV